MTARSFVEPRQAFEQRGVVMFVDMAGFSAAVNRAESKGRKIKHLLPRVRRTLDAIRVQVQFHEGTVIKSIGDTLVALFPSPICSVAAAKEIRKIGDGNSGYFRCCVGMAAGDVLVELHPSGVADVWGSPVNRAAKLGEDLAGPGEVLIDAHSAALGAHGPSTPVSYRIGGEERTAHKLELSDA